MFNIYILIYITLVWPSVAALGTVTTENVILSDEATRTKVVDDLKTDESILTDGEIKPLDKDIKSIDEDTRPSDEDEKDGITNPLEKVTKFVSNSTDEDNTTLSSEKEKVVTEPTVKFISSTPTETVIAFLSNSTKEDSTTLSSEKEKKITDPFVKLSSTTPTVIETMATVTESTIEIITMASSGTKGVEIFDPELFVENSTATLIATVTKLIDITTLEKVDPGSTVVENITTSKSDVSDVLFGTTAKILTEITVENSTAPWLVEKTDVPKVFKPSEVNCTTTPPLEKGESIIIFSESTEINSTAPEKEKVLILVAKPTVYENTTPTSKAGTVVEDDDSLVIVCAPETVAGTTTWNCTSATERGDETKLESSVEDSLALSAETGTFITTMEPITEENNSKTMTPSISTRKSTISTKATPKPENNIESLIDSFRRTDPRTRKVIPKTPALTIEGVIATVLVPIVLAICIIFYIYWRCQRQGSYTVNDSEDDLEYGLQESKL